MPQSELQKVISGLRKGGTRLGRLTDDEFQAVLRPKPFTTGNMTLDAVTGIGGFPSGRVIEAYGPPSSGKTTAALQMAANRIAEGGRGVFVDHERSLDIDYCQALGIDPDGVDENGVPLFLYMQPRSFENGADAVVDLLEHIDFVITDSVAAMVTEAELNSPVGKVEMMARARAMHGYMRRVVARIADLGVTMIFLNHVQDVVDTSPMGKKLSSQGVKRTTTPGGSALKFYSSVRIEFRQMGNLRSQEYDKITNSTVDNISATRTSVFVAKNKVGKPFGKAELRVRFGRGFSNEWSALDLLVRHGLILKDGAIYRLLDPDVQPTLETVDEANGMAIPTHRHVLSAAPGMYGHKAATVNRPAHWWLKGEDQVMLLLEADPAFRGAAITKAREILAGGWDVTGSADEIAAAQAEEKGEIAELKEELASDEAPPLHVPAGGGNIEPNVEPNVDPTEMDNLFGAPSETAVSL